MNYNLDEVIDTLQKSATEALKDGGTSEWGHRTLQIVEWLKEYRELWLKECRVLKPKTGKWKTGYNFPDGAYWKCSCCDEIIKVTYPMKYCPNCGVEMEGKE